ncbi:MAG: CBS domain-containing protein [Nitrospinae bacterium]|nr:CBS domain-containing protein [Nitrospinota bacterium]MBL7020604.1 CBS domain-containing protein [Nitrospinaceae bacterium]
MSDQIFSISQDKYAYEAIDKMYENKVSTLLVRDGGKYVGIITKTDWMFLFLKGESDTNEIKVSSLMTEIENTIDASQSVTEAGDIVEQKRVRHIPVTSEGKVVGMFSVKDLEKYYLELHRLTKF